MWKRALSVVLAAGMLTGCSFTAQGVSDGGVGAQLDVIISDDYPGKTGETIMVDSKWVNSMIDGSVDEKSESNLKDDFYTAVNKEWLLATGLGDESMVGMLEDNAAPVQERKLSIVHGESAPERTGTAPAGLTEERVAHNDELVAQFAALMSDWDGRGEMGAAPARKYIEAIEDIRTQEDLEKYLANASGLNFTQNTLLNFRVEAPLGDKSTNAVVFDGSFDFLLASSTSYINISANALSINYVLRDAIGKLLGDLGYTEDEIKYQFEQCYKFEFAAAEILDRIPADLKKYETDADKDDKSMAELKEIAGAYPVEAILAANGLDQAQKIKVYYPDLIGELGALYTEERVPQIRAYYLIHTAAALLPFLSRELFDQYQTALYFQTVTAGSPESYQKMTDDELLLEFYFGRCFPGVLEQSYVSRYCSQEQKDGLMAMTKQYLASWREIIQSEDWLLDSTKAAAIEKLDAITVRCLYPDTFADYTGLSLADAENSADAINAVNRYMRNLELAKVDTPLDRTLWDESVIGKTTDINAVYNPADNSVTIYAGIMATNEIYNESASFEQNLARIGTIVGHEISHAFDASGSEYDKDGNARSWWELDDLVAFQTRVDKLAKYYSTFTYYPGSMNVMGTTVQGEAMADMGGMKASLLIAKTVDGFNYDEFFRSNAQLWRTKCTFDVMKALLNADSHPAAFLRANITLTEFDEFVETYGIEKGDGMYKDPKDRVAVW